MQYVETCPFCPGNEGKTPPAVMRVPRLQQTAHGKCVWFANKFAAVAGYQAHASHSPLTPEHGRFLIQDVIVESPNHADGTCLMAESHVGDVLRATGLDRRIAHGEALHRTAKIQISITTSAQRPRNMLA